MKTFVIMVAFATILMFGGCQNSGTKKPTVNNLQTNDNPIQEIGIRGYRYGTFDNRLGNYSRPNSYQQTWFLYGADFVDVYGRALVSLPLGTVTYGGEDASDFVIIQPNPDNRQRYSALGYVEIDVNFTEGKITRFDAIATRPHAARNLPPEKIVELKNSDEITVDTSTGKFGGISTLTVTTLRNYEFEEELVDGSPYKLTVNGYFHGDAKNSALSGILYNEKAVGAVIAVCATCE